MANKTFSVAPEKEQVFLTTTNVRKLLTPNDETYALHYFVYGCLRLSEIT